MVSWMNSTKYLKKKKTPLLLSNFFHKFEEEGTLPTSLYGARISQKLKPDKDTIRNENCRSLSLMNIFAKILRKILANLIQHYPLHMVKFLKSLFDNFCHCSYWFYWEVEFQWSLHCHFGNICHIRYFLSSLVIPMCNQDWGPLTQREQQSNEEGFSFEDEKDSFIIISICF